MDHLLGDAKRLIQRLTNHDNSVDILISEATNLQNKLIAMRQYKEEVNKLNDIADHRPRSTLILGSQLENQRIQNLEQENRELSISLAEHQSALELIMNKYREQVLLTMSHKPLSVDISKPTQDQSIEMVYMKERIAEMARVMLQSAAIDDNAQIQEIEFIRRLQVENENLRELLEISGQKLPSDSSAYLDHVCAVSPNSNHEKLDFNEEIKSPRVSFCKPDPAPSGKPSESVDDLGEDSNGMREEELFNSLPKNKRYGGRKAQRGVFDTDDQNDTPESNNNAKNKQHIQKLQNLFKDPSQGLSDDVLTAMDPSESCFRAIISDIKPLDFNNIDINEKLSEKLFENVNTTNTTTSTVSEKLPQSATNPFLPDIEAAAAAGKLSGGLDTSGNMNETSVLEFLDSIVDASSRGEDLPDSLFSKMSDDTNIANSAAASTSPKKLSGGLFPSPLQDVNVPLSEIFTKKDSENDMANGKDAVDDGSFTLEDQTTHHQGDVSEEDSVNNAFSDVDKAFTDTSLEDAFGFLDDEEMDFVDGDVDDEPESSPDSSPGTSPVPQEHDDLLNGDDGGTESKEAELDLAEILKEELREADEADGIGEEMEALDFLDDMLDMENQYGEDEDEDSTSGNVTVIHAGRESIGGSISDVDRTISENPNTETAGSFKNDSSDTKALGSNDLTVTANVTANNYSTQQPDKLDIHDDYDSEATCTDSEATLDADIDQTLSDFDSIFDGDDLEDEDIDLDEDEDRGLGVN